MLFLFYPFHSKNMDKYINYNKIKEMLMMLKNFELMSKQNDLDILKCEYLIESATLQMDMEEMGDYVSMINGAMNHNFYHNFKRPGQDEFDYANNMYKTNKAYTKDHIVSRINSAMDKIGDLFNTIAEKVSELFEKIKERFKKIMYDVRTKASIKKLQYIIQNKAKFNKYVVDDARPEYVKKLCDNFNIEVNKLMIKSKKMGSNTLEAKFNALYNKTMKQIETYMGEIPKRKKITVAEAAKGVLDQLKKNPQEIDAMRDRTTDFVEKIGQVVNTDPESLEKKSVMGKIVSKVTALNGKCADFIAKHPFAVTGAILAAGVAASGVSYVVGDNNGYIAGKRKGYHDGYDDGLRDGRLD